MQVARVDRRVDAQQDDVDLGGDVDGALARPRRTRRVDQPTVVAAPGARPQREPAGPRDDPTADDGEVLGLADPDRRVRASCVAAISPTLRRCRRAARRAGRRRTGRRSCGTSPCGLGVASTTSSWPSAGDGTPAVGAASHQCSREAATARPPGAPAPGRAAVVVEQRPATAASDGRPRRRPARPGSAPRGSGPAAAPAGTASSGAAASPGRRTARRRRRRRRTPPPGRRRGAAGRRTPSGPGPRPARWPAATPGPALRANAAARNGPARLQHPPLLEPRSPGPPVQADLGRRGAPHHPAAGRTDPVEVTLHGDVARRPQLEGHRRPRPRVDRRGVEAGLPAASAVRAQGRRGRRAAAGQRASARRARQAQLDLTAGLEADARRRTAPRRGPCVPARSATAAAGPGRGRAAPARRRPGSSAVGRGREQAGDAPEEVCMASMALLIL